MRIIGGIHRSRTIVGPPDAGTTRPITDRVKEALFNRLMTLGQLGGGNVLDAFCGTGSLGLEALSRGAEFCTFVDRDRKARILLQQNLQTLKLTDQAEIIATDAVSADWSLTVRRTPVFLAFFDPPYALVQDPKTWGRVQESLKRLRRVLEDEAALVLRTPKLIEAPALSGFEIEDSSVHGTMRLSIYLPVGGSAQ